MFFAMIAAIRRNFRLARYVRNRQELVLMRAQAEAVREKCNNNLWEFNVQRSRRDTGLIFTHRLQELEKHLEDATAEVERIDHFIAQIGRWIDELHHQKAEQEVPLSALRQTAAL